jgi:hypothetical protein
LLLERESAALSSGLGSVWPARYCLRSAAIEEAVAGMVEFYRVLFRWSADFCWEERRAIFDYGSQEIERGGAKGGAG